MSRNRTERMPLLSNKNDGSKKFFYALYDLREEFQKLKIFAIEEILHDQARLEDGASPDSYFTLHRLMQDKNKSPDRVFLPEHKFTEEDFTAVAQALTKKVKPEAEELTHTQLLLLRAYKQIHSDIEEAKGSTTQLNKDRFDSFNTLMNTMLEHPVFKIFLNEKDSSFSELIKQANSRRPSSTDLARIAISGQDIFDKCTNFLREFHPDSEHVVNLAKTKPGAEVSKKLANMAIRIETTIAEVFRSPGVMIAIQQEPGGRRDL